MSDIGVQTVTRYAKTYSWITDIIKSYDGTEQRIAVRQNPRTTFELEYVLEDDEIRVWKDTLFANLEVGHNLPLWDESVTIPLAMAATDTSVAGDFSLMDTDLAFNILIMSQDGETWESKLVLTRDDTTITFSALVNSYAAGAVIIPWEFSYIDGSPSLNLHTNNAAVLGLKTTASNHRALEGKGAPGKRTPLADLDFSAPVAQSFPTTAAALAAALGDVAATPSYIWLCDEASGNLVDEIASEALVTAGSPLQGQDATGLNITSPVRNAIEYTTNSDRVLSANTAFLDQTTGSFAVLVVYRLLDAGGGALLGKRNASTGFSIHTGSTFITAGIDDSTVQKLASYTNTPADGAWRCAAIVCNRTSDLLWMLTDEGSSSTDITGYGSLTNTNGFGLGWQGGWNSSSDQTQVAYLVAFEGAAAEALDQAALDSFWTHATDPTGLLTTQTRNSAISVPVAADAVAHFAPDTLPIGYHAAFTDTNKLGLYCSKATTNHCPVSEDGSNAAWFYTSSTHVAADADAPDGFRSASEVTQTAVNGRAKILVSSGLSTSTEYTLSVWMRAAAGAQTGTIAVSTSSASDLVYAEVDVAMTATWQRFTLTFTTDVGQTTTRIMLYPGESAVDTDKVCHFWGVQLELGGQASSYLRTSGSAATSVSSAYEAAGNYINIPVGEVAVTHTAYTRDAVSVIYDSGSASSNRRYCYYESNGDLRLRVYSDSGTLEDNQQHTSSPYALDTEHILRHQWDTSTGGDETGGYEQRAYMNGVLFNGQASPWENTPGTGFGSTIRLGASDNLVIQRLVAYDTTAESAITTYKAKQVLDRRHNSPGTVANTFSQQIHRHDFGHSISQSSAQAYGNIITPRAYTYRGAPERQWWKTFLLGVQGRRVAFYAPTYRDDYALVSQPSTGSSTILVTDTPNIDQIWDNSTGHANLALQTDAGLFLTEVTTSLDNADGTYTLTISPALPGTVAGSTINVISFLELVHLGNDSVRFTTAAGVTTVDLTIQTVEA